MANQLITAVVAACLPPVLCVYALLLGLWWCAP